MQTTKETISKDATRLDSWPNDPYQLKIALDPESSINLDPIFSYAQSEIT